MHYLRTHLGERDLSPARIARAHNISVRHLYTVLGDAGIVLGDWIRDHRLEQCRRDLSGAAEPPPTIATIAAIAARWGFADASHFSRAFKAAYGESPREWRARLALSALASSGTSN